MRKILLTDPLLGCTTADCKDAAFAAGLCTKHYFRKRRTGDPAVRQKPGPKGARLHKDEAHEIAAMRERIGTLERELAKALDAVIRLRTGATDEVDAQRTKVAALEQELTQAQAAKPANTEEVIELRKRYVDHRDRAILLERIVNEQRNELKALKRELADHDRVKASLEKMKRVLANNPARAEREHLADLLDQAREDNRIMTEENRRLIEEMRNLSLSQTSPAITKAQKRILQSFFHSDRVTDPALKKRHDEAFKIVNNLRVV
jgi:hypothetical protein